MPNRFMVVFAFQNQYIQIKSPELGDKDILDLKTTFNRMMDGTFYSYKSTPPNRSFKMVFTGISHAKALALADFLAETAGQFIQYTDYNGFKWTGKITTTNLKIKDLSRHISDIDLEFEVNNEI
jgi:hypothetical protein